MFSRRSWLILTRPSIMSTMDVDDEMFTDDELRGLIPHIFLPRKLPSAESERIVEDESNLLRLLSRVISTIDCIQRTKKLFNSWAEIQNGKTLFHWSKTRISTTIRALKAGEMFALYVRAQNAGMMISSVDDGSIFVLSTWQASVDSQSVMSTAGDLAVCYPELSITIPRSELVESEEFAERLIYLAEERVKIAMPQSRKSGSQWSEIRDVADPMLVTEWVSCLLSDENSHVRRDFPRVSKKIRDEVNLGPKVVIPFRRSGLWITAKVALQIALVRELGEKRGRAVYKFIMSSVTLAVCRMYFETRSFVIDLGMQMIAKVARRMQKLEAFEADMAAAACNLKNFLNEATFTIQTARKKMDDKWTAIVIDDGKSSTETFGGACFSRDREHRMEKMEAYIRDRKNDSDSRENKTVPIPLSYPVRYKSEDFPAVQNFANAKEADYVLADIENWMKMNLDRCCHGNYSKRIKNLAVEYANKAAVEYRNDPVANSRVILFLLKAIRVLDQIVVDKHPLFRGHKTGVDATIVNKLLLPLSDEMKLAHKLETYFGARDAIASYPSLIEEQTISQLSFSARFAAQNTEMQELLRRIREREVIDIENKKSEVRNARKRCEELQTMIPRYSHEYRYDSYYERNVHESSCTKCSLENRLNNCRTSVAVYERRLPLTRHVQNGIVFELSISSEIACLRDLLCFFQLDILKKDVFSTNQHIHRSWLSYEPIRNYNLSEERNVNLGTTSKLYVETHYNSIHPDVLLNQDDNFIVNNGQNVQFYGEELLRCDIEEPAKRFTMKIERGSPYQFIKSEHPNKTFSMQWAIDDTVHTQNQVLARQYECSPDLMLTEFKEFGSLRAGYRIQYRNIYRALTQGTLSLSAESVVALIAQTIWQTKMPTIDDWRRCAHVDCNDHSFGVELIALLRKLVDINSQNWTQSFIMINIILLASRLLELSSHEDILQAATDVLLKCRTICTEWGGKIEEIISKSYQVPQKEIEAMKLRLLDVAMGTALTYRASPSLIARIFRNGPEDVNQWLNASCRIYNEVIRNPAGVAFLSPVRRVLLRMVQNTAIEIEKTVSVIICNQSDCLNKFVNEHWAESDGGSFQCWQVHRVPANQIYESKFIARDRTEHSIRIDVVTGKFLVNGYPLDRLPEKIVRCREYKRVFENVTFEVQPSGNGVFTTTNEYHGSRYKFYYADGKLVVTELSTSKELVHHEFLHEDVPEYLCEDYSHWWDREKNVVCFQPKSFVDESFSSDVKYEMDLESKFLSQIGRTRNMIYIQSETHKKISRLLARLELQRYIHAYVENATDEVVVELPRMGLTFSLDGDELRCLDYYDMKIKVEQKIGVFVGLNRGLLLEGRELSPANAHRQVILMPHGKISFHDSHDSDHQTVRVDLQSLRSPPFFVFEVDKRMRVLKAGQSHAAWLYLAALHNSTASPLPDPFTDLTGTEMAFRILQSGRCWSGQPYDAESIKTLAFIRSFAPKRHFYPDHLNCMQRTEWPRGLPTSASHDGFIFIVELLFKDSTALEFLFATNHTTPKCSSDLRLNERSYLRNVVLMNPEATISSELNGDIAGPFVQQHVRHSSFDEQKIKNVRILSNLGHIWKGKFVHSVFSKVKSLLVTHEQKLNGLENKDFIFLSISEWLDIDFRNGWIDLYELARIVERDKLELDWTMLLCSLAFCGSIDIDHLLLLQLIAVEHRIFVSAPDYKSYEYPEEIEYDSEKIKNKLRGCDVGFDQFSRWKSFDTYDEKCEAIKAYERQVDWQITNYVEDAKRQWPTENYVDNVYKRSAYIDDTARVKTIIETFLQRWYQNYTLNNFFIDLQNRVTQVKSSCYDSIQFSKYYSVDDTFQSVPRFNINFEELITHQLVYDDYIRNAEAEFNFSERQPVKLGERSDFFSSVRENDYDIIIQHKWEKIVEIVSPEKTAALRCAGLYPRICPCTMLPRILQDSENEKRTWLKALIGEIALLWAREQRRIRCINFARAGKSMEVALARERESKPYENWKPSEKPEWLIIELELNLTIRPIQVSVAEQMMRPKDFEKKVDAKNSVMQLNMGEGKTKVIVPMLIATLANGNQLCRLTVLKSLFNTNFQYLRQILGGILNRRVYNIPCRRDMDIKFGEAEKILRVYEECVSKKGVVVTLPEYRCSFQLKVYELAEKKDFNSANKLLEVRQWLNEKTRDILDECDEILYVKYQLVYTMGEQLTIDGGDSRWTMVQRLLKLLPERMQQLHEKYGASAIEYPTDEISREKFPPCRLIDNRRYQELIELIAEDFLDGRLVSFPQLRQTDGYNERELVKSFLTQTTISKEDHKEVTRLFDGNARNLTVILILAGYLKFGVLEVALSKRWRVNYGVNPKGHRRMAVPFRAKDVAAERTEFGHPDVAIVLTQLSYYYSGLGDEQLLQCFEVLEKKHPNPSDEYDSWIRSVDPSKVHPSVSCYKGINLSNYEQRIRLLFPILTKNMTVIDFWLSNLVYPKESKQFAKKMTCTAWDLCSESQKLLTTGFSGTNDSTVVLPATISPNELPELEETNAQVEDTIRLPENDNYRALPAGISGRELLENLVEKRIKILLDVGAIMLELSNEQVGREWLKMDHTIDGVVYFTNANELKIKTRKGPPCPFELSPLRERLQLCAVYLDDIHTRGTDIRFPIDSKACVTLGGNMTRDKLVQACMRMRLLGKGHTICFWASQEADKKIRQTRNIDDRRVVGSEDVLSWVRSNSDVFEREGLVYWATAGINYAQKYGSHLLYEMDINYEEDAEDDGESGNPLRTLGVNCVDPEIIKLTDMYGKPRDDELFVNLLPKYFATMKKRIQLPDHLVRTTTRKILQRCEQHIPKKKKMANLLDEEQEKELEHELEEERQLSRPAAAEPRRHRIADAVTRFVSTGLLEQSSSSIVPLPDAFRYTDIRSLTQENAWGGHIYCTEDFVITVRQNENDDYDEYLRNPNWIATSRNAPEPIALILSPFEADHFISTFRSFGNIARVPTTLHMFASRVISGQSTLINDANLQIPSRPDSVVLDREFLAPLFTFSGCLYFDGEEEQNACINFLGLIPRPRTTEEEAAFDEGKILRNGFVPPKFRKAISHRVFESCKFNESPENLVLKIVETRHGYFPPTSHLAKILIECRKVEFGAYSRPL